MVHERDRDERDNPLRGPVSRLEFYVVMLVAVGTKTLPFVVPAASAILFSP